MAEVAIIADDLTGGAAVGVEFARHGCSVMVVTHVDAIERVAARCDVVVINTETRNVPPSEAARVCSLYADRLPKVGIVIKKIDSLLRGSIAEETDVIAAALGVDRCLLIAASPAVGRTTSDGIQYVDGVLLEHALSATDPTARITRSSVVDYLKGRTRLPVHHLPLASVVQGHDAIMVRIDAIASGMIVADAMTDDHVGMVTRAALGSGIKLIVGSYGVGEPVALATLLRDKPTSRTQTAFHHHKSGPLLIVAGSLSRQTEQQAAHLMGNGACFKVNLAIEPHFTPAQIHDAAESARQHMCQWRPEHGNILLTTSTDSDAVGHAVQEKIQHSSVRAFERLIAAGMLHAAESILPACGGIIVSGGSTAQALLDGLGACSLQMHDQEILSGMPFCTVEEGDYAGLPFLIKPGSYGGPSALADACNSLMVTQRVHADSA